MNNAFGDNKPAELKKRGKWRAIGVPLLTILLGIGITVALYLFRDKITGLGNYGYLGAFLISLITSATVFLPVPGIVALFALAATLNPLLIGLAAGAGGIIGEMTGFLVGYGGHEALRGRSKLHSRLEKWMRRWGSWGVFAVAAAPLPLFDVAGIIAGALRFPLWKFLLIGWVGKTIKLTLLIMAGAWGWEALIDFIGSPPPIP
ncbi:MAG: DedA family protein [Chloroflexi bacterium]|nr:DedA family protein [Chloroflexota bacterium]